VELYADGDNAIRHQMESVGEPGGTYRATIPATRPAADFTARVTPSYDGVAVPLEVDRILWQR
jgi:starch phosphorylase